MRPTPQTSDVTALFVYWEIRWQAPLLSSEMLFCNAARLMHMRVTSPSGLAEVSQRKLPMLVVARAFSPHRGVRVLTANGDDLTDSSDPSRVMMRQIAGAFHQYEKARLVAKLKAARQRKRELVGKVEGRNSWAETKPELVKEARRLRRRSPKGGQRSLRAVADELARLGYTNERGATFSASSIASMVGK